MPRYWTLAEAQAALPDVILLLQELQENIRQMRTPRRAAAPRAGRGTPSVNGHGSAAGPPPANYEDAARRTLNRLDDMGVQVKDLETGLIDFPCLRNGEEVLLCYRLGEPDIGFWHDLTSGIRGRRPISEL